MTRLLIVWIACAGVAWCCGCSRWVRDPLCQNIGRLKAVFVGTPLEVDERGYYRFTVEETFFGFSEAAKQAFVSSEKGTSCHWPLKIGVRHLVFSYGAVESHAGAPLVRAGGCSGTRPVSEAAEELQFLRLHKAGATPTRIFGLVGVNASSFLRTVGGPPVAHAAIQISGPGGVRSTVSGDDGRFEFADVSPGTYRLTAHSPGFTTDAAGYELNVPPGGCGFVMVGMLAKGVIAGRVIDHLGRPAGDMRVEYMYAGKGIPNAFPHFRQVQTNRLGQFEFTGVPPGELLLGVRVDSAPDVERRVLPTYWPNVTDAKLAKPLVVSLNEQKRDVVIRLGPPPVVRKVRVKVEWRGGQPAVDVPVSARIRTTYAEVVRTNADGVAVLTLLCGPEYTVSSGASRLLPANSTEESEELALPPGCPDASVTLVLTTTSLNQTP